MIQPVSFRAIPIINTPERREKAVKIAVPSLMTSSAVMLATRAAKGADQNQLKMTTRLARAGVAGLVTAAVVSALTLVNKETVVQGVNKVKEIFKRNPAEKELDNTKPIEGNKIQPKEAEEIKNEEQATENIQNEQETETTNPFVQGKEDQKAEIDKAIKEIEAETAKTQPIDKPVTETEIKPETIQPAKQFSPHLLNLQSNSNNPFSQVILNTNA